MQAFSDTEVSLRRTRCRRAVSPGGRLVRWLTPAPAAPAAAGPNVSIVVLLDKAAQGAAREAVERGVPARLAVAGAADPACVVYLGRRTRRGHTWDSFRKIEPAGGFDHVEFLLSRAPSGEVRAIDMYFMSTDEEVSETVRRVVLPQYQNDPKSLAARLSRSETTLIGLSPKIAAARQAMSAGEGQRALELLDLLPREFSSQKWVLALRIEASRLVGKEAYAHALEQLQVAFPDDPGTNLALVDLHLLRGHHDDALTAVATAEKHAMPDAHFDVVRAGILLEAGRLEQAKALAERAAKRAPRDLYPYWTLVAISLASARHAETTKLLTDMGERFGLTYDLEQQPEYAQYIASPQYRDLPAELLVHRSANDRPAVAGE